MTLDSQGKIAKLCPCILESQKLEDAPEQGQHISFLGSQMESCGSHGVEPEAPLLGSVYLLTCCTAVGA